MSYREVLVRLIENGTPTAKIYTHLRLELHLSRPAIMELLNDCGVTIPLPPSDDEISDERRRFLQELSMS
jgi:hypothetical protein